MEEGRNAGKFLTVDKGGVDAESGAGSTGALNEGDGR